MSYATTLAAIKTLMESVTNIGNVFDYVRWNKDWPITLSLIKVATPAPAHIRFWDISRKSTPEEEKTSRTNLRLHTFQIRGFISLDDSTATEKTLQNLVEDVATMFRNKPTLNGTALIAAPLQINNTGHAMVGDVLCNMVDTSIKITEEIQWQE